MYRPEWDEDNREDDENDNILNDELETTEYRNIHELCRSVIRFSCRSLLSGDDVKFPKLHQVLQNIYMYSSPNHFSSFYLCTVGNNASV